LPRQAKQRVEPVLLVNAFPRRWQSTCQDCWGTDTLERARRLRDAGCTNGPRAASGVGLVDSLRDAHARAIAAAENRLAEGAGKARAARALLRERMQHIDAALERVRALRAPCGRGRGLGGHQERGK
jgi:hypothetical protein